MPVYIYRCENCNVQFEKHQSFTEEPLKTCPECGHDTLRKVLTPAGIVFKGSGWYATDHKSASGLVNTPKTEPKETPQPVETSTPAAESKPATPSAPANS